MFLPELPGCWILNTHCPVLFFIVGSLAFTAWLLLKYLLLRITSPVGTLGTHLSSPFCYIHCWFFPRFRLCLNFSVSPHLRVSSLPGYSPGRGSSFRPLVGELLWTVSSFCPCSHSFQSPLFVLVASVISKWLSGLQGQLGPPAVLQKQPSSSLTGIWALHFQQMPNEVCVFLSQPLPPVLPFSVTGSWQFTPKSRVLFLAPCSLLLFPCLTPNSVPFLQARAVATVVSSAWFMSALWFLKDTSSHTSVIFLECCLILQHHPRPTGVLHVAS